MSTFRQKLAVVFRCVLQSRKLTAYAAGLVAALLARIGLHLDNEAICTILYLTGALIGAIAIEDVALKWGTTPSQWQAYVESKKTPPSTPPTA